MAHLRFIMRAAKFAYTFALFRDWTEVVGFTASLQITTQLTLIFSVYCKIVYDAFVERTVRINFSEKQNPAAVCQGKKQKKMIYFSERYFSSCDERGTKKKI